MTELSLRVSSNNLMLELLGDRDRHLRDIETAFPEVRFVARGNELVLSGPDAEVSTARTAVEELLIIVQEGQPLEPGQVDRVVTMVREEVPSPAGVFTEGIAVGRGKFVHAKTAGQKRYIDAIRDNTLIFGVGPAGTGKTYLAMAAAIEALSSGAVRRILLTRPAVEAGERLGFLPGDLQAKVDPYLRPLYDALYEMLGPDETHALMDRGTIEIAPLAYMRGRTLNDSFVILDEAQNTSPQQMKMFLTRLGFNSKMVVTGDITQTDLPTGMGSGLTQAKKVLSRINGVAFITLKAVDVVRHRIVAAIVEAYQEFEDNGADRPPEPAS